ncbi:putative plant self-incompatibility S1 [Medicago truncatula]|uniref:S-protein homolog n=1 Tax=Medicago truncatula TaxID=3880 RepID=A0A072UHL2_MEDTR|nr:leguminosin group486 secreted peptide [Medicago truncatula]RHN50378.1 putative plant self-incompatibility S1 [Medicago truncatula]
MEVTSPITLKFSIFLIMVLFAFEVRETLSAFFVPSRVTVTIVNNIQAPTATEMTLDCKSKDNDLGNHTILWGSSYVFSFKPSADPFRVTLFYCSFIWPQDPRRHYLNIWDQNHDKCTDCLWQVNVNGGCLNNYGCGPFTGIQLMDANNTSKWSQRKGLDELGDAHPSTP